MPDALPADGSIESMAMRFLGTGWGKVAVTVIAGVIIYLGNELFKLFLSVKHRKLLNQLKSQELDLTELRRATKTQSLEIASLRPVAAQAAGLQRQVAELTEKHTALTSDYEVLSARKRDLEDITQVLTGQLEVMAGQVASVQGVAATLEAQRDGLLNQRANAEKHLRRIQKLKGKLIDAKALQKVPKFRPLAERKRAIISVLNLKGGVGKTTVTANLGGALARRGYRVLLVDLDLQGSLSGLMLDGADLNGRTKNKLLLQDFFNAASNDHFTKLSRYTAPVPVAIAGGQGSLSIVPCSDSLAYAELNLSLSWLLKRGKRDPRLLLRKALHLIGDNEKYDIVLLDCPPLLNISCVNALAASDYLLVPTLLSMKAAERVPRLLTEIHGVEFKKHINSQLQVLGVLANRTYRDPPTTAEGTVWTDLPKAVMAAHVPAPRFLSTIIAQDVKIAACEEQYNEAEMSPRGLSMFDKLALEIEGVLPSDCRILAPVSAQSQ